MRWMSFFLGAALLFIGVAGCNSDELSTDPSIFVDVNLKDPKLNIEKKSALDLELTGGFTLVLHLGPRASGTAEVNLQGFSLKSDDQKTIIVDSVSLTASGKPLPILVEPDSDETVPIEIDPQALAPGGKDANTLCMFGGARFVGTLTDSLRGGMQNVVTGFINVTGTGCTGP